MQDSLFVLLIVGSIALLVALVNGLERLRHGASHE